MKVIIDRFEGAMAIAEISEGKTGNLPRILIPDAKVHRQRKFSPTT